MSEPQAAERRRLAVQAATATLEALGLVASEPTVLKDSNNTVVWMRPLPIVAKVDTSTIAGRGRGRGRGLELEQAVLAHLSATDAPVARLAAGLPRQLHRAAGRHVLLLDHLDVDPEAPVPPPDARRAVAAVHEALRAYPGPVPPFTDQLDRVVAFLDDPAVTPGVSSGDRAFLRRLALEFRAAFVPDGSWQPLHGDPWIGGNLLATAGAADPAGPEGPAPAGGPAVLVDFEAACAGPPEWDWTVLPDEALPDGVDRRLVAELRRMRSLVVAVWCLAQPGRAPEVDEAAAYHLGVLTGRG